MRQVIGRFEPFSAGERSAARGAPIGWKQQFDRLAEYLAKL